MSFYIPLGSCRVLLYPELDGAQDRHRPSIVRQCLLRANGVVIQRMDVIA